MNSPVQKIKERLTIEEVVSSYIKLEKSGSNLKAKCPFHNEKTPSFFISPDRGSYYCFGCAAKGDIFTFVQEFEGLDFKGALKLLADKAMVPLESFNKEENVLASSEKENLYKIMEEATNYFSNDLKQNKEVLIYLKNRGLEEKTIESFRIGFAKLDWRLLYFYLQKKGFKEIEIEKAGLIKKTETEGKSGYYDRFRGRIMFPIADSSGRVIAFSGRILIDDGKSAKYLNSPDTPIFSKSRVLYGLDKAKDSIRKNNFSILVEGQFDLVMSHQAGYKNTIATSGTALSDLTLVKRLSDNIVFIFDADKAGFMASMRAASMALALDMNVKGAQMPEGFDPADLILKNGAEAWREVIKNSKHIIEFLIDKFISLSKDVLKTKLEIQQKIIPYLHYIKNEVKKSHFISLISNQSGIREEDIRDFLKKDEVKNSEDSIEIIINKKNFFRKDHIERRLLGIGLWKDDKEILDKLGEAFKKYEDVKSDLIFEAEALYQNSEDLKKDVEEMLINLEVERINEELLIKMQELHMIKDKNQEIKLLQEINELNNKKDAQKNKTKK